MSFYLDEKRSPRDVIISFTSTPRYDFGAFAHGYHLAAKSLAEAFLKKPGFADYEGYPIVFMYRHALELHFKNIIYWAARLCAFKGIESIDHKLYNTHDLSQLVNPATSLLSTLFPSDKELASFVNELRIIASEFSQIDSTSCSYRYPIDSDGNHSTKQHQSVNILSIYSNLEPVLEKLSGVNFGLEMESDLAQKAYGLLREFSKN